MSLDILKKQIKNNDIKSLYLFYGPEEFLKKYYVNSIEEKLLDKNTITFNRTILEDNIEVSKIIDSCDTLPVFSDRKLIIVKNSGLFKGSTQDKKENKKEEKTNNKTEEQTENTQENQADNEIQNLVSEEIGSKTDSKTGSKVNKKNKSKKSNSRVETLLDYIKDIPSYSCIIFCEDEIDKRLKLSSEIRKNGLIVEFPYQKSNDLVKWVINILKSKNRQIHPQAASFLVEISDFGMTGLKNEIDKLIVYAGNGKTITEDDVRKVGSITAKSIIFDLTDAIVAKDLGLSLKLLDDMIALKEPIPKIIFMIARQFRQMYQVKILLEEGLNTKQAASKLNIHPYAMSKLSKALPDFTIERLKDSMKNIFECDRDLKTGKMKDRMALELLIEKLTFIK